MLRGFATVNFFADDLIAVRDWYADLFGVEAYFQRPDAQKPAYIEFRVGDYEDELASSTAATRRTATRRGAVRWFTGTSTTCPRHALTAPPPMIIRCLPGQFGPDPLPLEGGWMRIARRPYGPLGDRHSPGSGCPARSARR